MAFRRTDFFQAIRGFWKLVISLITSPLNMWPLWRAGFYSANQSN